MKSVPTYNATIYVGFRVSRTANPDFKLHTIDDARVICRAYCDEVGLCVTITPTEYLYVAGGEPGCIVGLINYPRFPATPEDIKAKALELAERLRGGLGQMRVSIVLPDETIMLGDDPEAT